MSKIRVSNWNNFFCFFSLNFWLLNFGILCVVPSYLCNAAKAQSANEEQSLENMLDQVDKKKYWKQIPVTNNCRTVAPVNVPSTSQSMYSSSLLSRFRNMQNLAQPGFAAPASQLSSPPPFNGYAPFASSSQPLAEGPSPFSAQGLLRTFFGAGAGFGNSNQNFGNSAGNSNKDVSVQSDCSYQLQYARDQAAQAESDAERARYGDQGGRQSAASSAQYHANAARNAADKAYSMSYGSSQTAQNYAAQARNAANRAQEAADRARYNASLSN